MKKIILTLALVLLILGSTIQTTSISFSTNDVKKECSLLSFQRKTIVNPYENIDFKSIHHYKANLHTHTLESDGSSSPAEVIYYYHDIGNYDILSLTDHNKNTWPWNDFIPEDPISSSKSSAYYPDLEMLAISGNEMSANHHRNSLLNDYPGGGLFLGFTFWFVEQKEGLSFFNHPGRYDYSVGWYQDFYDRFDSLIGMEVYNQGDRYDQDRLLWDQINKDRNPDDLVWALSNDDMHHLIRDAFRNYQYFLMNDLTEEEFRSSFRKGSFYFCYEPNGSAFTQKHYGEAMTPKITDITVSDTLIQISAESFDTIKWINDYSTVIATGSRIDVSSIDSNFVRAELINEHGKSYTQPFGILS